MLHVQLFFHKSEDCGVKVNRAARMSLVLRGRISKNPVAICWMSRCVEAAELTLFVLRSELPYSTIFQIKLQWMSTKHLKMSSDTIFGKGAILIYKLLKMKLFTAPQSSVVHIKASSVEVKSISGVSGEDFLEVWRYWGLQALFVTVFQTSVDLLFKNSHKNSSLLGPEYLDCILSNNTVGCCNINFSKKEKNCLLCMHGLYTFVVLFAPLQLFRCYVWPTFHPPTH